MYTRISCLNTYNMKSMFKYVQVSGFQPFFAQVNCWVIYIRLLYSEHMLSLLFFRKSLLLFITGKLMFWVYIHLVNDFFITTITLCTACVRKKRKQNHSVPHIWVLQLLVYCIVYDIVEPVCNIISCLGVIYIHVN